MARFDFSQFPHELVVDEITLNDFLPEDAQALESITEEDVIQKYIPWAAEDKEAYIRRTTKNRDDRGPRYAIRVNNRLAGHFAIFPSPDTQGVVELGYVLDKDYRGKGVITRLLPVCEGLVLNIIPGAKTGLCINDSNISSRKVAARLGYAPTETISQGDRLYLKPGAGLND